MPKTPKRRLSRRTALKTFGLATGALGATGLDPARGLNLGLAREESPTFTDAAELVEPILNGNARRIFDLAKKTEALKWVDWSKVSARAG